MLSLPRFAVVLLLAVVTGLSGHLIAVDAGAKVATITGVIDHLDGDNSRVVIKTISPDPTKVKTAVITIDKTSTITIDKAAATYDDLKVDDQVAARYSQGVAVTLAVTRTPAKGATPPAKP